VILCCVLDILVWVLGECGCTVYGTVRGGFWGSDFVVCVREFGVSLGNECVLCVGEIGAG